jgi:hypothetical protein
MAITPTNFENLFLQLVNEARAEAGVKALTVDGELVTAARDHDAWMDSTDTFSHTGVDGSSPGERISDANYGAQGWGENIAYVSGSLGEDTVRQLHNNLMKSPGHYENIVRGSFEEIGIGLKEGTINGHNVVFVTQAFGTPNAQERADADDVGTVPATDGTPVSDAIPDANVTPTTDLTTPVVETTPATDVTPVTDLTLIADETPVTDATPTEETPVTEVTPGTETTPVTNTIPGTDEIPVTEATPDTDATPSTGVTPTEPTTPATETTEDRGDKGRFKFGGRDADTFTFLCKSDNKGHSDTAQDEQNQIDLTDLDGNADEAHAQPFTFLGYTDADPQSGQIALHEDKATKATYVEANIGGHDFSITLKGIGLNFAGGDFHI